jgi:hypothetical protein
MGLGDMDFTLAPYWIIYSSFEGSTSDIDFVACGLAVIAALKLCFSHGHQQACHIW